MNSLKIKVLLPGVFWLFCLGGCVGIPTAIPEATPFKELVRSEFVVGETTSQAVADALGAPQLERGNEWVYRDGRDGWRWFFCFGVYYSGGCASTDRTVKDFFLLTRFDDEQILEFIDIYDKNQLCNEARLCYEGEYLMQVASEPENLARQSFQLPVEGCTVYIYSDTNSDSLAGSMLLDGVDIGDIVGTAGYYAFDISPGPHFLVFFPGGEWQAGTHASELISCDSPQLFFLRYHSGFFGPKLDFVDKVAGQEAIETRWIAATAEGEREDTRSMWLRDDLFVTQTGRRFSAFNAGENSGLMSWGTMLDGEMCGTKAAFEDYGLHLIGSGQQLMFRESTFSQVEVIPICNESGDCTFPAIFREDGCRVWRDEKFSYTKRAKILVIEPDGDGYREVFYGSSRPLIRHSECQSYDCYIDINTLREFTSTM